MTEPMTDEQGYQLCVEQLRGAVDSIREKLADGTGPVEIASRLTIGYTMDPQASRAAPGLLAVALVLLTTAEVL